MSTHTIPIKQLWQSGSDRNWRTALDYYWSFVQPRNMALERELDELKVERITSLDPTEWYDFLHDKYFRWKYTAPNRYATTTRQLRKYWDSNQLDRLFDIKQRLLRINVADIAAGLSIAKEIPGLGIAGASGLLSLMYPVHFATVDQFAVKALCQVPGLPESDEISRMRPESLTLKDGIMLIDLMRRKARDNNLAFDTKLWTPRKIDMVLWTAR